MFIFLLSPNKKKKKITQYSSLPLCLFFDYPQTRKKKNLHSTRVYLYVYFLIIHKQEKKKKVLEPGRLEYCVNGTRVYQARVPQNFF